MHIKVYVGHLEFSMNKPKNYFNNSPPVSVHQLEQFREPKVIHRMLTHLEFADCVLFTRKKW